MRSGPLVWIKITRGQELRFEEQDRYILQITFNPFKTFEKYRLHVVKKKGWKILSSANKIEKVNVSSLL